MSPASVKVAIEAFEPIYFDSLLVALDGHFVHRLRAVEGKDGNPLNEMRMLCNALMSDNVLHADKTIQSQQRKAV